jgi:hypothetical protein
MLVWANTHGGYIAGIVIILIYIFSELTKHFTKKYGQSLSPGLIKLLIGIGTSSILLSFLNPNGYEVIPVLIGHEQSMYSSYISEWISPITQLKLGFYKQELILYFFFLLMSAILLCVNIRRLDLTDVMLFSGFTIASLYSARFIPFFVPLSVLFIARYVGRSTHVWNRESPYASVKWTRYVIPILLPALLGFVIIQGDLFKIAIMNNLLQRNNIVIVNKFPEGAGKFLKEHKILGNLFNPYDWGGYLIWTLYPDYKVFIDGRGLTKDTFFNERKIMEASLRDLNGTPEWKMLLDSYGVDVIITPSIKKYTGQLIPLIYQIMNAPEWYLIYNDNASLIFLRDTYKNRDIVNSFAMSKARVWDAVIAEAVKLFKESSNKNIRINALVSMGDAFFAKDRYKDARMAYLLAVQIDPENKITKERLHHLTIMDY